MTSYPLITPGYFTETQNAKQTPVAILNWKYNTNTKNNNTVLVMNYWYRNNQFWYCMFLQRKRPIVLWLLECAWETITMMMLCHHDGPLSTACRLPTFWIKRAQGLARRTEKLVNYLVIYCCGSFLSFAVLLLCLLLGEERERRVWQNTDPHHHLYIPHIVNSDDEDGRGPQTLRTDDLTEHHNVLHCGTCGQCSSTVDIAIYHETRNTLTTIATTAAKVMLFTRSQNLAAR
jgi:hypothetical protein